MPVPVPSGTMMVRFLDGKSCASARECEPVATSSSAKAAQRQSSFIIISSRKTALFRVFFPDTIFANRSECRLQLRCIAPCEQGALRCCRSRTMCLRTISPGIFEGFQVEHTARQGAGREIGRAHV